jgi:prefoldin beta subunit|eukprot:COSAG01_NODE_1985_length_8724_cov_304.696928_1_plen_100_part_00
MRGANSLTGGRLSWLSWVRVQEFKLLEDDANVFKLVGPVLVKQDLQEARANVDKRMQYIQEELGRVDGQTKESEKKLETQRGRLMAHQQAQQQARRQAQ